MYRKLICIILFHVFINGKMITYNGVDALFVKKDYQSKDCILENRNGNSVRSYTNKTLNTYKKIESIPKDDTSVLYRMLPSISVVSYFVEQQDSPLYIWYFPSHSKYSNKKKSREYRIKTNLKGLEKEKLLSYQVQYREGSNPYFSYVIMRDMFRIYNDRTISFEAFEMKKIRPMRLDTITIFPNILNEKDENIILVIPDSLSQSVRLVRTIPTFIEY